MSTVVMLGHPAPGHVNPTLPVVGELVRRGERVVYYATEPFRAQIERRGADFRPYGDHALFERNLGSGGLLGGMAGLLATTETLLPDLLARVRGDRPAYLLVEAHAVWGNLLSQILGLPTVTLCSMFAICGALISPGELIRHLYGTAPSSLALEGLLGLSRYFETARHLDARHRTSCPGILDFLGLPQALNIVFTCRDFQVGGEAFDSRYKFVGPSIDEPPPDVALPIHGHGSLVYISMGTMYNDEADLYRTCFRAFARRPVTVVMAVGHRIDRSRLPEPPANVAVCEYVPQLAVLRRAGLFVTHGGLNSAHEAMLYGVPMIVLPRSADHHIVAERVEAVGAGVALERSEVSVERLLELVDRVLGDPGFAARSRAMGESLRAAGGPRRAVDEIVEHKRHLGI